MFYVQRSLVLGALVNINNNLKFYINKTFKLVLQITYFAFHHNFLQYYEGIIFIYGIELKVLILISF